MSESKRFQETVANFLNPDGTIRRRVNPAERNTVHHDKWDRQEINEVLASITAFGAAQDDLTEITPTAPPAIADTFWEFLKVEPKMKDIGEVTPSHVVNHMVMEELIGLPDIEKIRFDSVLDNVASAMAVVDMEPELEVLFDKLQKIQEQSQQLEDDMIALSDGSTMGGSGENGEENSEKSGKQGNSQDNKELIKKAQELMKRAADMDKELDQAKFDVDQALKRGMDQAAENAAQEAQMADAWGLQPGELKKMPADERIKLAMKMRSEKFKRMARIFGPMLRLAIAEQERKVNKVPHEIMDIETGADLHLVLPTQFLNYFDEDLELLFLKDFSERNLLQYAMDGIEKIGRGSMIVCEDGSGSMAGTREIWAKAVTLCLLYIATKENRGFYGIHFGSKGEFATFDFDKNTVTKTYRSNVETFDRIGGTIAWAETFFNGGTDFQTPLDLASARLIEEFDRTGKTTGDIVFITDGECGLDDEYIKNLLDEKERCGFKIWSIIIGQDHSSLTTFSDRIIYLDEIIEQQSGKDITDVFGAV